MHDIPKIRTNAADTAILFLRMFIGGVMLLHIIGNLQDYDTAAASYRSVLGLGRATSFAAVNIAVGLLAAMIIVGVGTRIAALAMAVASAATVLAAAVDGHISSPEAKLHFVYTGIYVALVISGGGAYAFNVPSREDCDNVPK